MVNDPALVAGSLSQTQKSRLQMVAANEAVSEMDYVSLLDLGLINQPLAVNLPPTTALGTSVLRVLAVEDAQAANSPDRAPYLSVV